jgi:uroporphyrinogen-III synthase
LTTALARLDEYRHLAFTSQHAVRIVWDALRETGRDARAFAGICVSAVGPATAGALCEHGIVVDVSPERFVAEGVLEAYRVRADVSGTRVLYPAAQGARDVLPAGLRRLGATVDVVPIYRSVADEQGAETLRTAIAAGDLDVVTFTSASAVRAYVEAVGPKLAGCVPAASIGPITSEAARTAGIPVAAEAGESTITGLVAAVLHVCTHADAASDVAPTAAGGRHAW